MFRVISALSLADYCSLAGSQVNFVMKTGTINFQGSAFGSRPKLIDLTLELLWVRLQITRFRYRRYEMTFKGSIEKSEE